MKGDKAKNEVLLKDGLKELIKSYPDSFSTFVKNKLKQFATSEEISDYKKWSFLMALVQEIFFDGSSFLKKYGTLYMLLKNLVANKIDINAVNDDQKNFVFDLMKGYNRSSFFKKVSTWYSFKMWKKYRSDKRVSSKKI